MEVELNQYGVKSIRQYVELEQTLPSHLLDPSDKDV